MAKLFFVLFAFIAVSQAAISVFTYSDSNCQTQIGLYQSTDSCGIQQTGRSVRSALQTDCLGSGPYYSIVECTPATPIPATAVPNGWYSIQYTTENTMCDFSTFIIVSASADKSNQIVPIVLPIQGVGYVAVNTTYSCSNGVFNFASCTEYGCNSFDNMSNGTCTNMTSPTQGLEWSGVHYNSCVDAPVGSDSPMSAGTPSAPSGGNNGPTAGTNTPSGSNNPTSAPVKKTSGAAELLVGSVATIMTAIITLC